MSKKPPDNVNKLIKAKTKPKRSERVTLGKRLKPLGGKPKPKGAPTNVLNLIAKHLRGR